VGAERAARRASPGRRRDPHGHGCQPRIQLALTLLRNRRIASVKIILQFLHEPFRLPARLECLLKPDRQGSDREIAFLNVTFTPNSFNSRRSEGEGRDD
jgi:hypothetical protein